MEAFVFCQKKGLQNSLQCLQTNYEKNLRMLNIVLEFTSRSTCNVPLHSLENILEKLLGSRLDYVLWEFPSKVKYIFNRSIINIQF